jgi:dethiobiotin synthase
VSDLVAMAPEQGNWIVEGAGGALVPLNDRETMVDLMTALGLPVIVAARSTLGTINHTLMTLEVLRSRGLEVERVVMIGDRNGENRAAVAQYGRVLVDTLPWMEL